MGMVILGDIGGTLMGEGAHPLGINTLWETSSSEQESSEDGDESVSKTKSVVKCYEAC